MATFNPPIKTIKILNAARSLAIQEPQEDLISLALASAAQTAIATDIRQKHALGALCQLYCIIMSGYSLATKNDAVKKLIESPLDADQKATDRVKEWAGCDIPELAKYRNAPLTYRYLLKNIGFNLRVALAATHSSPYVVDGILACRVNSGNPGTWTDFGECYGFDANEWALKVEPMLKQGVANFSGGALTTIEDGCSLFPGGAFPQGFGSTTQKAAATTKAEIDEALKAAIAVDKSAMVSAISSDIQSSMNLGTGIVGAGATSVTLGDVLSTSSTTKGVNTMNTATATPSISIPELNTIVKDMINGMFKTTGINATIDQIYGELTNKAIVEKEYAEYRTSTEEQLQKLRRAASSAASAMPTTITVPSVSHGIPKGTMNMVQASSAFPQLKTVKLMVPKFTWDTPHPDVPAVNSDYIYRDDALLQVLYCLATDENAWLSGHTGSGKTTLIEQIAAHLGWPVARIAFDSNVDRSELVGRMSLKGDGKGGTESEWLPGILEKATSGGYILLCDEMDAGHPNALYTLQPLLEGRPLTLLEDGGRVVFRSPVTRIFATGNTTGNGDPSGLYPACRILSAATLDRFATFITVPYMTQKEERDLIARSVPGLAKDMVLKLAKFATEMRVAFTSNNTPVSYSPRRSVAFARQIDSLFEMGFTDEQKVISTAFKSKLYDAASEEFRQRLVEIANASLGGVNPNKTVL